MDQDIKDNIRRSNIKSFLLLLLFSFIFNFYVISGLISEEKEWFMILFMAIFAIPMDWLAIKSLLIAINPLKSKIFQKYGSYQNLQRIIDEINNTVEYKDKEIIISKNYVADPNDYERIVACDDILRVHKFIKKKNFAVVSYSVVLTDKYGFELHFTYSENQEKKVDELLLMIGSKCKNAQFGYTKATSKYINENKEELPKRSMEEIKKDIIIQCKVCGKEIKYNEYGTCEDCHKKIMDRLNKKEEDKTLDDIEEKLPENKIELIENSEEIKNNDSVIFCVHCGKEIKSDWKFCKYCGQKI